MNHNGTIQEALDEINAEIAEADRTGAVIGDTDDPPLIAGGQGRSDTELFDLGNFIFETLFDIAVGCAGGTAIFLLARLIGRFL